MESRSRGLACLCFEIWKNVRDFKTTVMTLVVKLDPPGPFLINVLVDVPEVYERN